jgi:CRP/FNR family transcriptional regulator
MNERASVNENTSVKSILLKHAIMNEETKLLFLQEHPLFAGVNSQQIRSLGSLMKGKVFSRGEMFGFGEGGYSKICLLIAGKIKISGNDDAGNELVKDILTAPDIFGDLSLDGSGPSNDYATALTGNTLVGSFAVADFRNILENHPVMALAYARTVNKKLKRLEDRHSDLVFRDARFRLIRFIKTWAISDGNRVGDKIILSNYLTHSDIAGVIATSRQSVNVLFNELRDSGLLFYNRKRIELNDTGVWN